MGKPTTIRSIYIKIGDGANPEVFSNDCTINTDRGIQFQSQGQDVYVPDCTDPETPAWRDHNITGLSATLSGNGVLDTDSIEDFDAWFRSGAAKNIQVFAADKGNWAGAFKLTGWELKSNPTDGSEATFSCTMESHGTVAPYDPA